MIETPSLLGSKITAVRKLTPPEMIRDGWDPTIDDRIVIELDNGVHLYASRDWEGNGPGVLVGQYGEHGFFVTPEQ